VNADDREEWRRIALGWLAVLRKQPMTPTERFETVANRLGTGRIWRIALASEYPSSSV
jgi:hypothetical protein